MNASIIAEKLHQLYDYFLRVKAKVSVACELLAIDNLHANEKLHRVEWFTSSGIWVAMLYICRKAHSAFWHFDNCVCLNQSLLSCFHEHMSRYSYDYVSFSMLIWSKPYNVFLSQHWCIYTHLCTLSTLCVVQHQHFLS